VKYRVLAIHFFDLTFSSTNHALVLGAVQQQDEFPVGELLYVFIGDYGIDLRTWHREDFFIGIVKLYSTLGHLVCT